MSIRAGTAHASLQRVLRIEAVGGFVWDPRRHRVELLLRGLRWFHAKNGHTDVPQVYTIPVLLPSASSATVSAAATAATGRDPDLQIAVFSNDNEHRYGAVPDGISELEVEPEIDPELAGFPLGRRVAALRSGSGTLEAEDMALLDALGFRWGC
jgi:hypothetical protein